MVQAEIVLGIPPFPQKKRKGWGTEICCKSENDLEIVSVLLPSAKNLIRPESLGAPGLDFETWETIQPLLRSITTSILIMTY